MIGTYRTARLLLMACAALATCPTAALPAAKPPLEVWTATPNPDGLSNCAPCNRFWAAFRSDAAFHDAVTRVYEVRPIYYESHLVAAKLRMVNSLPVFFFGNMRIDGFTTTEDFLVRLGLKRAPPVEINPPAAEPPQQPQDQSRIESAIKTLDQRLEAIRASVAANTEHREQLSRWLEADKKRQQQLDQLGLSQQSAIEDFNLRLKGLSDHLGQLRQRPDRPQATKPEDPPGTILETILQVGRYPATWFLGPLGGAGATALLWYYRAKKKRSSIPSIPNLPEPMESNAGMLERILDRMNRLEHLVRKPVTITPEKPVTSKPQAETDYVPYETDEYRKAVAFAHAQLVKKYPGAVGTVEFIDSLTDQYLQRVDSKEQAHVSK